MALFVPHMHENSMAVGNNPGPHGWRKHRPNDTLMGNFTYILMEAETCDEPYQETIIFSLPPSKHYKQG